jgi:hypothetical protein
MARSPGCFLLQQVDDPVPFGPAHWELTQWAGFAAYAAVFLLFVILVWRLARCEEAETTQRDSDRS